MALPITTPADYTGFYKISGNNFSDEELALYITQYEEFYGRRVLGDALWADLSLQVTFEPKYVDLIDGITYVDDNGDTKISKGLKEMLKGFIYHKYLGDNFISTTTGLVRNHNENSNRLSTSQYTQTVNTRYNLASDIYDHDIWPFLYNYKNSDGIITSSVDNTGTYTITAPDTLYLEDGDIVTINLVEYTVSSVILNTSFVITEATAGLDFSGVEYSWEPFKDICQVNFGAAL